MLSQMLLSNDGEQTGCHFGKINQTLLSGVQRPAVELTLITI